MIRNNTRMSFLSSLRAGLAKTRDQLAGHWNALIGRQMVDDAFWEELEETLIAADFGVATTEKIVGQLKIAAQQQNLRAAGDVIRVFRSDVADYLNHPSIAPTPQRSKRRSSPPTSALRRRGGSSRPSARGASAASRFGSW